MEKPWDVNYPWHHRSTPPTSCDNTISLPSLLTCYLDVLYNFNNRKHFTEKTWMLHARRFEVNGLTGIHVWLQTFIISLHKKQVIIYDKKWKCFCSAYILMNHVLQSSYESILHISQDLPVTILTNCSLNHFWTLSRYLILNHVTIRSWIIWNSFSFFFNMSDFVHIWLSTNKSQNSFWGEYESVLKFELFLNVS